MNTANTTHGKKKIIIWKHQNFKKVTLGILQNIYKLMYYQSQKKNSLDIHV